MNKADKMWHKCQEILEEIVEARAGSKQQALRNGATYLALGLNRDDKKFSVQILGTLAIYNQHEKLGYHDTIEGALEKALDFIKTEILAEQIEIEERKNNTANRLKALQ